MPWALTTFGPDGALIVMKDLPLTLMNPGVPFAVTNWPTIVPLSLIPNAVEDMLPLGMKVFSLPRLRVNELPLPSVPTTVPAELVPKARPWSIR